MLKMVTLTFDDLFEFLGSWIKASGKKSSLHTLKQKSAQIHKGKCVKGLPINFRKLKIHARKITCNIQQLPEKLYRNCINSAYAELQCYMIEDFLPILENFEALGEFFGDKYSWRNFQGRSKSLE